ncbi:8-oxo-dGTP diphosphatase [Propionibacterium cyclohexanicum]|uniref:8-oxo-dGTP diphosphatase n=1 Tax=Propionibacterium cyclohexanicum TaxID=64702 RepID=A0A1H9RTM4_9ACTN|nr:NUDIX hydrolase [Propionibacterium cyclohexanicum]SER75987.1 8-oxo-dGTP diphosphatase [Propionibacterium cyclohexanicum]
MSKSAASGEPSVRAAGAVVFRGTGSTRQVLLEHRPGYDDWTLPKGKPNHAEYLPVTAVREVEEETGVHVCLGRPLPCLDYEVGSGPKRVWWWLGEQQGEASPDHDEEADVLAWPTVAEAHGMLTYDDEHTLLDEAVAVADQAPGGTILLVRHAKARSRKSWPHADPHRPLSARGHRQSRALAGLFAAYGTSTAVSSPSRRCRQTLDPFAADAGIEPELVALLSEEGAEGHARQVIELMEHVRARALAQPGRPLVVCGHRPVLADMQVGLGLAPGPMSPAECWTIHLDTRGEPVSVETHTSPI